MNYPRIILFISSFAIAISGGLLATPKANAESLSPFVNTAIAKEETSVDTLTIEQRKAILKEIISASQDEIENLNKKLDELNLNDEWSLARDQFIKQLATSSEYYITLEKRLEQESISLEDVKTIAKDLKDWREATHTPELKVAGNMILIFQTDDVRRVVQARNEKIANDIKKLDRQKLVNTETLKKYLAQADKSIKKATVLNTKAKDLYFKETIEPLQPKKLKSLEQEETSSEIPSSDTLQPEEVKDIQDEIRELSKESLKELKAAYELFFKMNDRIRK